MQRKKLQSGFTLAELMLVVAMVATIISLATAAMGKTSHRAAVKSLSEDVAGLITKTRISAMTTGATVTVCPVSNITSTAPACTDWTKLVAGGANNNIGWVVFKDYDSDGVFDTSANNTDVIISVLAFDDYGGKVGVSTDSGVVNYVSYNRKGELKQGSRTLLLSSKVSKYSGHGFDRAIMLATATGRVRNTLQ